AEVGGAGRAGPRQAAEKGVGEFVDPLAQAVGQVGVQTGAGAAAQEPAEGVGDLVSAGFVIRPYWRVQSKLSVVGSEAYSKQEFAPDGRFRRIEETTLMSEGAERDRNIRSAR
ncbi:hypothetical protein AB0K09_17240, partial [Streptomyces sp. NPDC049577]